MKIQTGHERTDHYPGCLYVVSLAYCQRLQDVLFEYGDATVVRPVHLAVPTLPEGVRGGCGTIRPAVPTGS